MEWGREPVGVWRDGGRALNMSKEESVRSVSFDKRRLAVAAFWIASATLSVSSIAIRGGHHAKIWVILDDCSIAVMIVALASVGRFYWRRSHSRQSASSK